MGEVPWLADRRKIFSSAIIPVFSLHTFQSLRCSVFSPQIPGTRCVWSENRTPQRLEKTQSADAAGTPPANVPRPPGERGVANLNLQRNLQNEFGKGMKTESFRVPIPLPPFLCPKLRAPLLCAQGHCAVAASVRLLTSAATRSLAPERFFPPPASGRACSRRRRGGPAWCSRAPHFLRR